jgi:XTP/dITP diphosphohydrolase
VACQGVAAGQAAVAGADAAADTSGAAGTDGAAGSQAVSDIGAELFALVARAREAGLDPELELRAAARRYRDRVRAWERAGRR